MTGSTQLAVMDTKSNLPAVKSKKRKNSISAKKIAEALKNEIYQNENAVPCGAVYSSAQQEFQLPRNYLQGDSREQAVQIHKLYSKIVKALIGYNVDIAVNFTPHTNLHTLTVKAEPRLTDSTDPDLKLVSI